MPAQSLWIEVSVKSVIGLVQSARLGRCYVLGRHYIGSLRQTKVQSMDTTEVQLDEPVSFTAVTIGVWVRGNLQEQK